MDLRQLKTFQTVALTSSFTRAAESLDYAQSSVTAQIRALEDELGVRLTTTMEFGSVEAIKQCVIANLGPALLPEIAVCNEVSSGRLITLPWFGRDFHMHTRLLWHKDKWLSPALGEFIHLSEQMLLANSD